MPLGINHREATSRGIDRGLMKPWTSILAAAHECLGALKVDLEDIDHDYGFWMHSFPLELTAKIFVCSEYGGAVDAYNVVAARNHEHQAYPSVLNDVSQRV